MLKETYEVTQSGRVISCEKIDINKYENKLTCLHFNYDNQIADGRKYIAILNPKTKRYRILPLSLDDTVTLSTDISRYPGIWQLILLVTEDDYEITNDDIDQTKCTYVSNIAKFIVVRDNFLSDETIEEEDSPAIQQLIDETVAMRDTLESYALGANEDYNKVSQLALQAQSSADDASSSEISAKKSAEIAVANAEASTLSAENAKASEDIAVECKNAVEALTEEVRTDTEFVRTSAQEMQANTETAVFSANLAEEYKNKAETASQEAVAVNAEIQMSKDEIIENINTARELLGNYTIMGDGTKFLSDDGSYKEVGASSQVQADWNQNDSTKNDYIKNRPFYDNTSTKTYSQTVWSGGYLDSVDDWTEIDNELWNLLLSKEIQPVCKYGTFVFRGESDDHIDYIISTESYVLTVSKENPIAYIMGGSPDGIFVENIEITCEVITGDLKKIDQKYLPEIPQQSSTMIVNITQNDDGTYSADKTYDEILEFHNNGGIVGVQFQGMFYLLH